MLRQFWNTNSVLRKLCRRAFLGGSPYLVEIDPLLDARRECEHGVGLETKDLVQPVLRRGSVRIEVKLQQMNQHLHQEARHFANFLTPHVFDLFRQPFGVERVEIERPGSKHSGLLLRPFEKVEFVGSRIPRKYLSIQKVSLGGVSSILGNKNKKRTGKVSCRSRLSL